MIPFLAIPTYDGRIDFRTEAAVNAFRRAYPKHLVSMRKSSLLCLTFNGLWADALNRRDDGITHFLMLHSDVLPQNSDGKCWATVLEEEMDRHCLDAVSAVVPIKDHSTHTSTAVEVNNQIVRLPISTFALPHTLTSADTPGLLINTGCLLVDLRKPWVEEFHFTMQDSIIQNGQGKFEARVLPEDWSMSGWMRDKGLRFGATSKVRTVHAGGADWTSWVPEEAAVAG